MTISKIHLRALLTYSVWTGDTRLNAAAKGALHHGLPADIDHCIEAFRSERSALISSGLVQS